MEELFDNLFIFEMANNHQGDVQHGLNIIHEMGRLKRKYQINAAVKLQYRDLDTFIHPDFVNQEDVKHIPRFLSTRLSDDEFASLIDAIRVEGMLTMVTPFDEASVPKCLNQGVDILNIASCSAKDWPLLEEVVSTKRPVIVSTGGCSIEDIDEIHNFLTHKNATFAFMHCVAQYPSENDSLCLNFLDKLKRRYPQTPIGWSGHESPENLVPITVAIAKGASLFERHVGLPTDSIQLNAYSMNPHQVNVWINQTVNTLSACGSGKTKLISQDELDSLRSLQRGVFANQAISKGELIEKTAVFFAMPCQDRQLTSGEYGKYRTEFFASRDYAEGEPIFESSSTKDNIRLIRSVIHEAKGLLYEAQINIGQDFTVELSHHHGVSQLRRIGAVIINIVNREYCKKLMIVLPGQSHPSHKHLRKEETFQLLYGDLEVKIDNQSVVMAPGEKMLVLPETWHSFQSKNGAVFEEISTTHIRSDSVYKDEIISSLDPLQRKTIIDEW